MNDKITLRALIVEDSEDDAQLLLRELRHSGYALVSERVDSAEAMRTALSRQRWDLILSDYVIPGFGGLDALTIAQASGLELPFILISNKVSEETLVAAMRAGAGDFLMKDRLDRLGPVVKRELADATARRGLRQARLEWRTVIDAVDDAILVHDTEFRIVRANLAYAGLAGLPVTQVIGKPYWEIFPKRDGPLPGCRNVMKNGGMAEENVELADGRAFISRSFAVSSIPGQSALFVHVMQDVTERKRVQEAIASNERRFRALLQHASDLVAVAAADGTITYISPSVTQLAGYEIEEALGRNYVSFVHPEDVPAAAADYAEIIRNPSVLHTSTIRFRNKDGTWMTLETVAKNALADPLIAGVVMNARDVTERNRAQQALAESEQRYRTLFDSGNDTVMIAGLDGRILEMNRMGCERLGRSHEDLLQMTLAQIDAPEYAARVPERMEMLRRRGSAVFESAHLRADAGVIPVEISARIIEYRGAPAILSIVRDVTERKRAEEQLRRLNWALRALGQSNSALVHAGNEKELFQSCCDAIAGAEGYPLAWVGLVREDASGSIEIAAAAGRAIRFLEGFAAASDNSPLGRGPTGTAIRTGMAQVIDNLAESTAYLPWIESARANGLASVISLPLSIDGAAMGALVVYADAPGVFGQPEVALFEELAADIGYGIASRRTRVAYEAGLVQRELATHKLRSAFESLIAVLAATVEQRDPYTAGHQRRVAELSAAIGAALGLDPACIEGLHFAATIHDIGKIYVPAEILSRPGKLSPVEFELIKSHVQVGYDIVKDVEFPWEVAAMIRQHHERLDGSGYPQGLKGDQIRIEARILSVADMVEAMSSHRPYRAGLGLDSALAQIRKEAGTRLDAQVVDACERVFREQGFAFSKF